MSVRACVWVGAPACASRALRAWPSSRSRGEVFQVFHAPARPTLLAAPVQHGVELGVCTCARHGPSTHAVCGPPLDARSVAPPQVELRARRLLAELDTSHAPTFVGSSVDVDMKAREDAERQLAIYAVGCGGGSFASLSLNPLAPSSSPRQCPSLQERSAHGAAARVRASRCLKGSLSRAGWCGGRGGGVRGEGTGEADETGGSHLRWSCVDAPSNIAFAAASSPPPSLGYPPTPSFGQEVDNLYTRALAYFDKNAIMRVFAAQFYNIYRGNHRIEQIHLTEAEVGLRVFCCVVAPGVEPASQATNPALRLVICCSPVCPPFLAP